MDMGEAIKYFINVGGITAIILGFLANLGNFISVLLGVIGFLYGCAQLAVKIEDYKYRRAERKIKEHEADKLTSNKDSSL